MTTAKRPTRSTPTIEAVRVDTLGDDPSGFTYVVLIDAEPAPAVRREGDRRDAPRRRTRLRSGKIVDVRGRFLTECLVHDLSATGVRLRVPAGVTVPPQFQVYDDQSGQLRNARVSWQRGGEAGVRFMALAETPRDRVIAADMRRKYYKLPR
jgi:hypothetical protein